MAVEYLVANGHRNIAFLSAPVTKKSRSDMLAGYRQALAAKDIRLPESNIVLSEKEEELEDGAYEFQNGRILAAKFLNLPQRPTAILAINDLTAFGIMQALIANGVRVPEDVSIVGFDNIELAAMVTPALTTVSQPAFETGRLACRLLLDSIDGKSTEETSITLQPQMVIRNSVARMPG